MKNKYDDFLEKVETKIQLLKINQPYASCPECVDVEIEDWEEVLEIVKELLGGEKK